MKVYRELKKERDNIVPFNGNFFPISFYILLYSLHY